MDLNQDLKCAQNFTGKIETRESHGSQAWLHIENNCVIKKKIPMPRSPSRNSILT